MPRQPQTPPRPTPPLETNPSSSSRSPNLRPVDEAGSASSSTAFSAADFSDFLEDAGPAFDPEAAPAAPEIEAEDAPRSIVPDYWERDRIEQLLKIEGNALHYLLRVGPEDTETWKYTEEDLENIAPPLTNILNRYDVTRAAAAAGDEIALIAGLTTYGTRNYTRRRRLLAARADAGPAPVTGVPAPEGTAPEDDEEWMRTQPPPQLIPKGHR